MNLDKKKNLEIVDLQQIRNKASNEDNNQANNETVFKFNSYIYELSNRVRDTENSQLSIETSNQTLTLFNEYDNYEYYAADFIAKQLDELNKTIENKKRQQVIEEENEKFVNNNVFVYDEFKFDQKKDK